MAWCLLAMNFRFLLGAVAGASISDVWGLEPMACHCSKTVVHCCAKAAMMSPDSGWRCTFWSAGFGDS